MRVVLREWLKRPKFFLMAVAEVIFATIARMIFVSNEKLLATIFDTLGDPKVISQFMLGLLLAFVVLIGRKYMSRAIHCQYTDIMNAFSQKILTGEYNMFLQYPADRLQSISEQTYQITGALVVMGDMLRHTFQLVILVCAISTILPSVAIPLVAIYSIGAMILWRMYKYWNKIDKEADDHKRKRNHELDMVVNGFKEVRGFCTENRHRDIIRTHNNEAFRLFCVRGNASIYITAIFRIINFATYIVVLWYCLPRLISGEITPAFAVLLASYAAQLSDPMEIALDCLDDLSFRLARVGEFDKFMSYENTCVVQRNNIELTAFKNEIRLDNVTFAYKDSSSDDILKNVSLTVRKGEHVGICGKSGGGKTTLFNIFMDYYTPNSGSVLVDGIDYRDINPYSLRKHIGIVNQDIYTFDDTIWYNVAYAKPSATESEVISACTKAGIYDFICGLQDGFQTNVGPKGLKLSGGQKQRIGLARVFLANPDIILLDEATSALDNESETIVQGALAELKDKTVITIAHRLSTIRDSDCIYVIEDGHIVESGTHEKLMEMNGAYAHLNK